MAAKKATAKKATAKKVAKKPAKKAPKKIVDRSAEILKRLKVIYPVAICELTHENAFQLLAATILSAQCTDARVNMVTPALFAEFPTAEQMSNVLRSWFVRQVSIKRKQRISLVWRLQ
jgi:endonuclease-3